MQLQLFKTMWGFEGDFDQACSKAIEAGFNGIEGRAPEDPEERSCRKASLEKHGLAYIAEIVTGGGYLHTLPFTQAPVGDLWTLNRWIAREERCHYSEYQEKKEML